jgi:GNAT superfamily N-acetyltransferase
MDEILAPAAESLLATFLREDEHYLASSDVYGDAGREAVGRAVALFLKRPEIGFVWLGLSGTDPVAVCVACLAVSTSTGTLVAKLDDVYVVAGRQRQGIGSGLLSSLKDELRRLGVARIDTSVHFENTDAKRFYERCGFRTLDEERLSLLVGNE